MVLNTGETTAVGDDDGTSAKSGAGDARCGVAGLDGLENWLNTYIGT